MKVMGRRRTFSGFLARAVLLHETLERHVTCSLLDDVRRLGACLWERLSSFLRERNHRVGRIARSVREDADGEQQQRVVCRDDVTVLLDELQEWLRRILADLRPTLLHVFLTERHKIK